MTQFAKDQFSYHGGYLMYGQYPERPRFVARFKYRSSDRAGFQSFLTKNFTVEEYMARLANKETPVEILESKGYVGANVKKLLKQAGYPTTIEGKRQYIDDQVAKYTEA